MPIPIFATSLCCRHWLTCYSRKSYSHRSFIFFIILPEAKTGSFTIELRWFSAVNKIRTGTLLIFKIFKYSTEHLKVPSNLLILMLFVNVKKRKGSFSGEASKYHKGIPYYPRKICKYLQECLILPGCFEFVLQIIIQNRSTSHANWQNFNREHNFVSVPWLCTIQNTSFSREKAHFRTPFFYNSSQWLLSNVSYVSRKGKTEKLFHTSRSSRPEEFCK